ncbi:hypothetical protein [Ruminococcus sp.]|uniref:hypothetical protein n=1 Tax=Ruminococcus sp. TaxID=41978 RepID=UPI001B42A7F8|nr:hypothetical protein [Ruminococcus sp.]MBP5431988.1 hypothetical protein [Ruminococcus sp.]
MTVDFYTIKDANNVVDKDLPAASKHTVNNVDIFKPSVIDSPRLVLGAFTDMTDKNYCYIDKFKRYYFINSITVTSAQRVIMDLTCDVLYTYKDDILKCKGTCLRSESTGKTIIQDNKYPINTLDRYVTIQKFENTPFTRSPSAPYILTTIGGT